MSESHRRQRELLDAALAIEDHEARRAYVLGACEPGPTQEAVLAMLDVLPEANEFLRTPPFLAEDGKSAIPTEQDLAGTRIGNYLLVERLGEGGHGEVWLAEQESPVRRKVALKLLKWGLGAAHDLARFGVERRSLARMDHPNIAQVFDAGTSDNGRPYFAMELLEGAPIHRYCVERSLPIAKRLGLFVNVCRAVQHAHQKGLIHRDLKSSNVLVTEKGGQATAKVIDFGIAKVIDAADEDALVRTIPGGILGSPASMSPEQVERGAGVDLDTRSDIYGLGVLLYELLTDRLPFAPRQPGQTGFDELLRKIREEDPPPPSKLAPVERDLDWITLKCLEKDRERRYGSADDLADEIERYLRQEPVLAHPPHWSYRLSKLWKRRRAAVLSSAVIALALLGGLAGIAFGWSWALAERDFAAAEARAARDARANAEERLRELEEVFAFQERQFAAAAPDEMAMELRSLLLAELRRSSRAGSSTSSTTPDRRDEELRSFEERLNDANLTNVSLAFLDSVLFSPALQAAREQFRDRAPLRAQVLGAQVATTLQLQRMDLARSALEEILAIHAERGSADSEPGLVARHRLAMLLHLEGRLEEAETEFRRAREGCLRLFGEAHDETGTLEHNFADLLVDRGRYEEALAANARALAILQRIHGEDHERVLSVWNLRARVLAALDRTAEAEQCLATALEGYRRRSLLQGRAALLTRNNLMVIQYMNGRVEEAERSLREVAEGYRRLLGDDHSLTLAVQGNLGVVLWRQKKFAEAEAVLRPTCELAGERFGAFHPDTITYRVNLGSALRDGGRWDEAERELRAAWEGTKGPRGERDLLAAGAAFALAELERQRGSDLDEAEALSRYAHLVRTEILGADHALTREARFFRARVHLARAEFAEAATLLEPFLPPEDGTRLEGPFAVKLPEVLVELYEGWERAEPEAGHSARAARWRAVRSAAEDGR